jgi:hypothetical protein
MDLMDWNRMLPVKTKIQVQNFGDQIDTTNIRIKHDATAPGNATTNIAKIDPETRSSQGKVCPRPDSWRLLDITQDDDFTRHCPYESQKWPRNAAQIQKRFGYTDICQ